MPGSPPARLRALFDAAVVRSVPTAEMLAPFLPAHHGRVLVLGAGKAAGAMAAAIEQCWPNRPIEGLVVTRHGHGSPCRHVEVVEASHPVPDAAGRDAAARILSLAQGAAQGDLVIFAISGGASALLALPAPGLTLEDKQAVNAALLRSGAPISAMNCVRKHLSAIKGGRLALAAAPARCLTLLVSDVPGDDPATIGSGPTIADPSTFAQARAALARYDVKANAAVSRHLAAAAEETPKPGNPVFANGEVHLIATPRMALDAAAALAARNGIEPIMLGDAIEGEAREVAASMARRALAGRSSRPVVLLSGGETAVTMRGNGRGGRNAEFALALAIALDGAPGIHAIACDTDGIDGSEDDAGAIIDPETLARAHAAGLHPEAMLANNDAWSFFARLGDLVTTGPTRTNVNDFRAVLVMPG